MDGGGARELDELVKIIRSLLRANPSPEDTKNLTEAERIEYQEIGNATRNDDFIEVGLTTVLLPVVTATIGAAIATPKLTVVLWIASTAAWFYWFVVTRRRGIFSEVRYLRARALEMKADLHHHSWIKAYDDSRKGFGRTGIKNAETLLSAAFFGAWTYVVFSWQQPHLAWLGVCLLPVEILVVLGVTAIALGILAVVRKADRQAFCRFRKQVEDMKRNA